MDSSVEKLARIQAEYRTPFYTTWTATLGPVNWANVFNTLYRNHRDKPTVDVIYTLIHNGTISRTRMKAMGRQIEDQCPRCNSPRESQDHIFFTCPSSLEVWNIAEPYARTLLAPDVISLQRLILVGKDTGPLDHPCEDVRTALVGTIWKSRNSKLFEQKDTNLAQTFKSHLTGNLSLRAHSNILKGKDSTFGFDQIAIDRNGKITLRF